MNFPFSISDVNLYSFRQLSDININDKYCLYKLLANQPGVHRTREKLARNETNL